MTATWATAALVFCRMNGLLLTLPVFSTKGLPRYVAVVISLVLTILIAPGVPLLEDVTLGVVVLGVASELLVGAALGLIVRALFSAFAVAAELLARQTALGMSSLLDPVLNLGQSSLGVLASWLAGLVFVVSNLHLRFVVTVADSFEALPPGTLTGIGPLADAMADAVETSIVLGVQLAAPLIALVFLVNVFIGILGRLAPRMNVFFSVGMTVNSVVGVWLFGLALPWMLDTHGNVLEDAVGLVAGLIRQVG